MPASWRMAQGVLALAVGLASASGLLGVSAEAEGRYYLHPDIQIAGMPKGGTSHLYKLLATHRDVRALRKEWCADLTDLQGYAEEVSAAIIEAGAGAGAGGPSPSTSPSPSPGSNTARNKVASACINPILSLAHYRWVKEHGAGPLENTPRFVYLLRDPVEVLWARFNFWTTDADAERHLPGRWTAADSFRTPEYFHDLLQAEGRVRGSFQIDHGYLRRHYMLDAVDGLVEAAGRDNVLIVNTADLEWPRVIQFLRRLANFTGLDPAGFDQRLLRAHTNSGLRYDSRGAGRISEGFNASRTGVYEVSGFRPVLPRSRAFIYARALSFCREVADKYGVRFDACLEQGRSAERKRTEAAETRKALGLQMGMVKAHRLVPKKVTVSSPLHGASLRGILPQAQRPAQVPPRRFGDQL